MLSGGLEPRRNRLETESTEASRGLQDPLLIPQRGGLLEGAMPSVQGLNSSARDWDWT